MGVGVGGEGRPWVGEDGEVEGGVGVVHGGWWVGLIIRIKTGFCFA